MIIRIKHLKSAVNNFEQFLCIEYLDDLQFLSMIWCYKHQSVDGELMTEVEKNLNFKER